MTGYEKMESYITENVAPEKIIKETTSARMSAAAARRRFCHLNLLDRQFNPEPRTRPGSATSPSCTRARLT